MAQESRGEEFSRLVDFTEKQLAHLEDLETSISSYQRTSSDLGSAINQLTELTTGMRMVIDGIRESGDAMRQMGTEEIVKSQHEIADKIDLLLKSVEREYEAIQSREQDLLPVIDRIDGELQQTITKIDGLKEWSSNSNEFFASRIVAIESTLNSATKKSEITASLAKNTLAAVVGVGVLVLVLSLV